MMIENTLLNFINDKVDKGKDAINKIVDKGLDFSKGFKYQDANLDAVHNSPDEIEKINNEKVSKFVGEDVSTYKLDDKDMHDFIYSLDLKKSRVATKMLDEGYSNEAMVAYIKNWDERKDPTAQGTGMFEKKTSLKNIDLWEPMTIGGSVIGGLGTLELGGRWLESAGNKKYDRYVRPTSNDVNRMIKNPGNESIYDNVNKALQEQQKKIDDMKASGASEDEIAKEQRVYDQMKESGDNYKQEAKRTTVDVNKERNIVGNEIDIAEADYVQSRSDWITKVEPEIVRSDAKFNATTDVLDKLTQEKLGVTKDAWERDYLPELKKMKKIYAKDKEMSLQDLQKRRNQIEVSKKFADKGEEAKGVMQNIYDHLDRELGDIIGDTLEKEHPGQGMKKLVNDYHLLKESGDFHQKKATTQMTKSAEKDPSGVNKRIGKKITDFVDKATGNNDMARQTSRADRMIRRGKAIQPSNWGKKIVSLINGIAKNSNPGVIDVGGILELGTLLPGQNGDAFREAVNTLPEGVAYKKLGEIQSAGIDGIRWNFMSDNERIDSLKEFYDYMYDDDVPRDDVVYTYYKWKGNSNGKLTPHVTRDSTTFVGGEGKEPLPLLVTESPLEGPILTSTSEKDLYGKEADDA